MDSIQNSWMDVLAAGRLASAGASDALKIYRVAPYFLEDQQILLKTFNCVLLSGVVFGGSIWLHDAVLKPLVSGWLSDGGVILFTALFNVLWLLPAYAVTFLISCMWYGEIAELATLSRQRRAEIQQAQIIGRAIPLAKRVIQVNSNRDFQTVLAENIYRPLLLGVFFLQAMLVTWLPVPFIGLFLNILLYSWLNALYCFDYKWALHGLPLPQRIHAIEDKWAYFAGFGLVCALPMLFMSFYSGAAVIGALYPLFIILACEADPSEPYRQVIAWKQGDLALRRLPIFKFSAPMVNFLLPKRTNAKPRQQ